MRPNDDGRNVALGLCRLKLPNEPDGTQRPTAPRTLRRLREPPKGLS